MRCKITRKSEILTLLKNSVQIALNVFTVVDSQIYNTSLPVFKRLNMA